MSDYSDDDNEGQLDEFQRTLSNIRAGLDNRRFNTVVPPGGESFVDFYPEFIPTDAPHHSITLFWVAPNGVEFMRKETHWPMQHDILNGISLRELRRRGYPLYDGLVIHEHYWAGTFEAVDTSALTRARTFAIVGERVRVDVRTGARTLVDTELISYPMDISVDRILARSISPLNMEERRIVAGRSAQALYYIWLLPDDVCPPSA